MSKLPILLAPIALLSAVTAIVLALAPGPLYAFGVMELMPAFALLLAAAPIAAMVAVGLGLLAAAAALWKQAWRLAGMSMVACALGAGVWLSVAEFKQEAAANPLHDVTTNIDTPPAFQALPARTYTPEGDDVRAAYPHPDWRTTHAEIYPDIKTVTLDATIDQAFERASLAAETMGWTIEAVERADDFARI
ncbi:MAG: hypothetical protein AAFY56_17415, partial [Pseudomonadota bacterium]